MIEHELTSLSENPAFSFAPPAETNANNTRVAISEDESLPASTGIVCLYICPFFFIPIALHNLLVLINILEILDPKESIFEGSGLLFTDVERTNRSSLLGELDRYCSISVKGIDKVDPLVSFSHLFLSSLFYSLIICMNGGEITAINFLMSPAWHAST
jgi:hypothetical protein